MAIDTNSPAYRALSFAAQGKVEQLKTFNFRVLNQLTPVRLDPLMKFTPMHYASFKKQWTAVAFLIQVGCSAEIRSVEASSRTVLSMLSQDKMSLHHLLSTFVDMELPWNLDAMVPLFTRDDLLEQRRSVLEDQNLLMRIGAHGMRTEALVMVASLMVGSYHWKGYDTDFMPWFFNNIPLPIDGTICCNQMLVYAAYFCGVSKKDLDLITEKVSINQVELDRAMMESGITPLKSMIEGSQMMAKHLGLPEHEKERVRLNPKKPPLEKIRVFYVNEDGHFAHYGLLVQLKEKLHVIHIDPSVTGNVHVAIDPADAAFMQSRAVQAKIYLSMLPWMNDNATKI